MTTFLLAQRYANIKIGKNNKAQTFEKGTLFKVNEEVFKIVLSTTIEKNNQVTLKGYFVNTTKKSINLKLADGDLYGFVCEEFKNNNWSVYSTSMPITCGNTRRTEAVIKPNTATEFTYSSFKKGTNKRILRIKLKDQAVEATSNQIEINNID